MKNEIKLILSIKYSYKRKNNINLIAEITSFYFNFFERDHSIFIYFIFFLTKFSLRLLILNIILNLYQS